MAWFEGGKGPGERLDSGRKLFVLALYAGIRLFGDERWVDREVCW